jgi:hypothetical protein
VPQSRHCTPGYHPSPHPRLKTKTEEKAQLQKVQARGWRYPSLRNVKHAIALCAALPDFGMGFREA